MQTIKENIIAGIFFSLILFSFCDSVFAQSAWINFNDTSGLYSNKITSICVDRFDNVWTNMGGGTVGFGFQKFNGTNWILYDTSNSDLPRNDISQIKSDTNGIIWMNFVGGNNQYLNGLTKFDGHAFQSFDTLNSNVLSNASRFIQIDKYNRIWLGCTKGLSCFDGVSFLNYPMTYPQNNEAVGIIVEDSSSIWIGSYGLIHYNPITDTSFVYSTSNSNIPSDYISSLVRDSSGNIWLGFNFGFNGGLGHGGTNGGLAMFDGNTFTPIWPFTSTSTGVEGLKLDHSGNLWVSSRCAGLYKFDGMTWQQIPEIPLTECSYSLDVDKYNNIWYAGQYTGVWTNKPFVGVNEINFNDRINVYPNPASNDVNIDAGDILIQKCSVLSILGTQLKQIEKNDFHQLSISLNDFSAGIYILKIQTAGNAISFKRVVKK